MNKLPFTDCFPVFVPWVVEAVNTHFNRAIALHVKDLQSPGNKFASHPATDIRFDTVGQRGSAKGHPALIVIELHIFGEERGELLQIATVLSIEQSHTRAAMALSSST